MLDDPLLAPGSMQEDSCPTGRNARRFTTEGIRFSVAGKCVDASTAAVFDHPVEGLTLRDGQVRVEARFAERSERARFGLWVRRTPSSRSSYLATLEPGLGAAALYLWSGGESRRLGLQMVDLSSARNPLAWSTLGVRLAGTRLWVLLDDQPILGTDDATLDAGEVSLGLARTGNPDDEQEIAVLFRNLRVSALLDGDPARFPTYQPSIR